MREARLPVAREGATTKKKGSGNRHAVGHLLCWRCLQGAARRRHLFSGRPASCRLASLGPLGSSAHKAEHYVVKVRDVIRRFQDDGWTQVRQRGSHRQFKHPSKPGLVTVAGHPSDELAPGTLNSVLK